VSKNDLEEEMMKMKITDQKQNLHQ